MVEQAIRILGIDPGLRFMGWGIIEARGNHCLFIASGCVTSVVSDPLSQRLSTLFDGLNQVLEQFKPHEAAVEQTFVNKDAGATLKLGQARGIALLAPAQKGLNVAEYAPNAVKKTVVGVGHADKEQIKHMVKMLLPKAHFERDDAADALAIALCHAQQRKTRTIEAMAVKAEKKAEKSLGHFSSKVAL